MKSTQWILTALLLAATLSFAQSDRGTVTGTVVDQAGAVVPGVEVVLISLDTGVERRTQTTDTGNYTLGQAPAGVYSVNVAKEGFRKFSQSGIRVQVAQTVRVDVTLQVGSTTESITVTADAPLLKTENAEQSTVISGERINRLPLNFGTGAGAIRNPLTFLQLAPGTSVGTWNDIRVNGTVGNTFRIIFEGQDTTSALNARVSDESQPSVDAVEEFTLQSSNFNAEFGQVGGGLLNFTARSGANAYHGTAYEYMVNEALNAGIPFTNDGQGGHLRSRNRQHDFGGNAGGPVWIPKLYNGKDKTFFFFNYEMFRRVENRFDGIATVPTEAFRNGDFRAALTGRVLAQDPAGRSILENTIHDPLSNFTVAGRVLRNPFPDNRIPVARFDPVAAKIQELVPRPQAAYGSAIVNNFENRYPNRKIQAIPSIKIDHSLTLAAKISGYFSTQRTDKDNGRDGLPDPISQRRDQFIRSHTVRINYDHTLRPTLLLHLGAGYQRYNNPDSAPPSITEYDAAGQLGFRGHFGKGFPRMFGTGGPYGGIVVFPGGQIGGTPGIGVSNRNLYLQDKPTAVASVTYIRGNHTYKLGGDWRFDTFTNRNTNLVAGQYTFSNLTTGMPATEGQNLQGGSIGHNYASFLLGLVSSSTIGNPQDPQYRREAWALFLQDTWKATRRLTVDYGLRWDLQPASRELHRRTTAFAPAAGGLLGATNFEGSGQGRCNCTFTDTYPYAIAPRVGVAYQINPKTVFRAGWGLSYAQLTGFNYIGGGNSLGFGFNTLSFSNPAFAEPAFLLRNGMVYNVNDLLATSLNPGIRPQPGQLNSPPALIDPNGGRPPRIMSWSIGVQHEITRDLLVEASYVGNRGAWFRATNLVDLNAVTPQLLAARGLDISRAGDRAVLTSRLDSPQAVAGGFRPPYAGYPLSATVAQSLRPFPQFGGLGVMWNPLGNSWYDSLQIRGTKRFSHGLDFTAAYTWSKNLTTVEEQGGETVPVNDVFNRRNQKTFSRTDQPHIFVLGFNYEIWSPSSVKTRPLHRALLSGWLLGGVLRYASGTPIRVPGAQNNLAALLFRGTFANRVPGEPLFLKDPNCHCIDPNKEFALNPRAWRDPGPGEWGFSAAYYGDYRFARRHDEQLSIGKIFRLREGAQLQLRAEFFNVLNRVFLPNPDSGNALATQQVDRNGVPIAGFGRMNVGQIVAATLPWTPRTGQLVARFTF